MMNPLQNNETYTVTEYSGRDDWLNGRSQGIGGSDAAAAIGMSHWKTNVQLWREKTRRVEMQDISDNPAVAYGSQAEDPLRRLYELDHPEYKMYYEPNIILTNNEYKHQRYSPDGILYDKDKKRWGIFENKTTRLYTKPRNGLWVTEIPREYYIQVLHGLNVTGFEFVELQVQINHGTWYERKTFHIEREEALDDMAIVTENINEFWSYVVADKEPPLLIG